MTTLSPVDSFARFWTVKLLPEKIHTGGRAGTQFNSEPSYYEVTVLTAAPQCHLQ